MTNELHRLLEDYPNVEDVQALIDRNPDVVKEKVIGDLPLRTAVYNGASLEVIQLLIQEYPDALQETDGLGWLPMHVALFRCASYEVLELLIEAYPDAARVEDDEVGSLPLHYAADHADSTVVQLLIDAYPDAVEAEDNEGNLPLHYAAFCTDDASKEVIQLLIQENPDTVKWENCNGTRPLKFPQVKEIYDRVISRKKRIQNFFIEEHRPRWSRQAKAKNYLARVRRSIRNSRYNRVHNLPTP